ncbi:MAG TPA: hypothetical protein EYP16_04895 [Candidatus Atribacteria bacterium]|nr:hypothetical protein [Candidatus Atribacteria bacterium]
MIKKYIKQITRGCGEKANFILTLKWETKNEAIKKILDKSSRSQNLGGLFIRAFIGKIEFNIYATGKILVKGAENENELNKLLKEIFT